MYVEQVYNLWKLGNTSSFGTYNTIYHRGSYLLLFGKKKLLSLEFQANNSSGFKTSASLF